MIKGISESNYRNSAIKIFGYFKNKNHKWFFISIVRTQIWCKCSVCVSLVLFFLERWHRSLWLCGFVDGWLKAREFSGFLLFAVHSCLSIWSKNSRMISSAFLSRWYVFRHKMSSKLYKHRGRPSSYSRLRGAVSEHLITGFNFKFRSIVGNSHLRLFFGQ